MTKNQQHEWRERGADGSKRYIRGYWDSRQWRFTVLHSEYEGDWEPIETPSLEQWEMLRDLLWRKYQRKKLPFKYLENIDKILVEVRAAQPVENDE
ncbi:MAG: hypothetical protein JWO94_1139 [Verrucomicrobiaceae bacterium]|nr:hypothetical protein [Verrucomicrobiaceae bacterium]